MQKLFSILISLIVLLQSLGFDSVDIIQLDEFMEHAQFHSEQYGDNVLVFISKHYGELKAAHDEEHQEEKEEHEQLPFQQVSNSGTSLVFTLQTTETIESTVEFSEFNKANFYYKALSSSLHSEGLFQPPRLS
ncbi:hypothetical protein IMCC3317_16140 [Kordia antarctica]|uniref:Uncharacterized protein n=1 Tax=Kordia antarctica TaxID=1218801 RepID=A0A7L4ZI24_9FLAO|nr:hypothetical protein [Kordia antarctica]QHI36255.1 hypothetical protein IMCC3317_16140 [Kordia antarctica]